ncbi:MAG TPA: hypothetical protein VH044_04330 [Polyangiaceae bacterium]|nr:hypothetical protein [Polyangiaceae bacterium]
MNGRIPVVAAMAMLVPACRAGAAGRVTPTPSDLTDATTDDGPTSTSDGGPAVAPPPSDAVAPSDPCNGEPAFCGKAYDQLTYPTTHAAMAVGAPPFACPAQQQSIRAQLDHGIRALDLEVHPLDAGDDGGATDAAASADGRDEGGPDGGGLDAVDAGNGDATVVPVTSGALALCLGGCGSGQASLASALTDVRSFLDVNPREVITLLLEGAVDAGSLAAALTAANLDGLAFSYVAGDPWPTLGQMIAAGQRVVILADTAGAAPPWMLPLWTYVAETGRTFASTSMMSCNLTRGPADAPLYLLNEFLVDPDGGSPGCGTPALAQEANAEPFFADRTTACIAARSGNPAFIAVDDYDVGDVFGVTRALDLDREGPRRHGTG